MRKDIIKNTEQTESVFNLPKSYDEYLPAYTLTMKLLVAITVAEYREKLEEFFSQHQVKFFNEFDVTGVNKPERAPHRVGNWFGSNALTTDNIVFFTMIDDDQADNLLIDLNQCKKDMPNCNIQAYVLNIEKGM